MGLSRCSFEAFFNKSTFLEVIRHAKTVVIFISQWTNVLNLPESLNCGRQWAEGTF